MDKSQRAFQRSLFDQRSPAEIINDLRRSSQSRILTQGLSLTDQGLESIKPLLNDQRLKPTTRSLLDELLCQYQKKSKLLK